DGKWDLAEAAAERVRDGYRALLADPDGEIALGANTHELVVRLLSALDLVARPRLVTTDGEFHSLRRQVDRLAEAGLEVVKVPAEPVATLAERLAAAVDRRPAAVMVSAVLFGTARVVPTSPPSPGRPSTTEPRSSSTPTTPSARSRSPSTSSDSGRRGSPAVATSTCSWARATPSCGCP